MPTPSDGFIIVFPGNLIDVIEIYEFAPARFLAVEWLVFGSGRSVSVTFGNF